MSARRRAAPAPGQLDLLGPPAEGWWHCAPRSSQLYIVADSAEEAKQKAEAQLRGLGVIPGGPPGLHESYLRMSESARHGRR
jgi:hypothetical protein